MSIFTRFTIKSLVKNRTRTVVSIIGVALSVALITAVLTSVVSLSRLLIERTAADEGWWYAEAVDVSGEGVAAAESDPEIVDWTAVAELGAVSLGEDNSDLFGSYLYAKSWPATDGSAEPLVAAPEIVAGRGPEAPGEIVLPHYLQNVSLAPCGIATADGGAIALGSTVELALGTRTVTNLDDGSTFTATSYNGTYLDADTQRDGFAADLGTLRAQVVGFYRSIGYSSTTAMQGNSAYVYDEDALERVTTDESDATWASLLIRTEDPARAIDFAKELSGAGGTDTLATEHRSLLRWMGVTPDTAIWNTLYQIAAILAAIVVVAGVSLVYNSFAISVAERTRQFGLLSSLGASRRQLRRTVLTEALLIGAIGVPAGLALGLIGCFTVFGLLGEGITAVTGGSAAAVVVSPGALAIAAALGLVTLLLSAWLPARRASRVSAVDAIRQTQDVRLSRAAKRAQRRAERRGARGGESALARPLGIAGRLFGIPGFIAHRNLTRSSSKGRVTVAALAVSVALLITSGSIADVMSYASGTAIDTMDGQDLILYIDATGAEADQTLALANGKVDGPAMQRALERFYAEARSLDGAQAGGYTTSYVADALFPASMLTQDITELEGSAPALADGRWYGSAYVEFIDDASWQAYVDELGLSRDAFCDPEHPRAIAVNSYDVNDGQTYGNYRPLASTGSVEFLEYADLDGRFVSGIVDGPDGTVCAQYFDDDGTGHLLPLADAVARVDAIEVGALADHAPACTTASGTIKLVLPASAIALSDTCGYLRATMTFDAGGDAERAADAEEDLTAIARDFPELDITYTNVAQGKLQARLMATTVNTFIYCFAVITGLIAVTNVFNTLANALMLRRREFAMLKSIGMGNRAFRRMIAYECASYALRGFAIGFVVALLASFGLYQSMMLSYSTYTFRLPWAQVALSFALVAGIILVSCAYALTKSRSSSVVEALRTDAI